MSKLVGSIILFVALGATSGLTAQTHLTGEAVDSALDSSLFEVGPFRLSPFLSFNSGYDSNSFSSSTAAQDDYTAHFGPGVRIVVPAGNRGFMELQPELNYVYYDEQDSLRNLNSRVALSGGIGTRRLLVQVANVFSNGITRPTSEFDIPVSVKQNEFSTSAHVLLGWRQELRLKMAVNDLTLDDSIGSLPRGQLDQLLGPRQTRYGVELHRYVSSRTRLVGVFELRNDDFDDVVARDAESRRVGGGFTFGRLASRVGTSRLTRANTRGLFGRMILSYQRTRPDSALQASFSGLVADVDVGVGFREKDRLRFTYARDLAPSIFTDNWFFVQNRIGGDAVLYLSRRLFVSPAMFHTRNAYPRPERVSDEIGSGGVAFVRDRQWTYRVGVNVHLKDELVLRVDFDYLRRSSNFSDFQKNRFMVGAGLTYAR